MRKTVDWQKFKVGKKNCQSGNNNDDDDDVHDDDRLDRLVCNFFDQLRRTSG